MDDLLKDAELRLKRTSKERDKITIMNIVAQKQRVSFKVSLICLPNNNELGFGGLGGNQKMQAMLIWSSFRVR